MLHIAYAIIKMYYLLHTFCRIFSNYSFELYFNPLISLRNANIVGLFERTFKIIHTFNHIRKS